MSKDMKKNKDKVMENEAVTSNDGCKECIQKNEMPNAAPYEMDTPMQMPMPMMCCPLLMNMQCPMLNNIGYMGEPNMGMYTMSNIPMNQLPMDYMPMDYMPMSNMPIGQMPAGNMPIGQMPVSNIPMNQIPISNMPMGQMPLEQYPSNQPQISPYMNSNISPSISPNTMNFGSF